MQEFWDVYDENGHSLNKTHPRGTPMEINEYHIVIYAWVFTRDGKIVLTKRHPNKGGGGLWECTGGAVQSGESSIEGAVRELREEIGLKVGLEEPHLLYEKTINNTFTHIYIVKKDIKLEDLVLQKEEVVDSILVSVDKLLDMWNNKLMFPKSYLDEYFVKLSGYIQENIS